MKINYDLFGSNIRHYWGGNDIIKIIEKDPNYFRLWNGYDEQAQLEYGSKERFFYQAAVRENITDVYSRYGVLTDEKIDLRSIQKYINRTIMHSGSIKKFIDFPSNNTEQEYLGAGTIAFEQINKKNSLYSPTQLYGYFDIPKRKSYELGKMSSERENLYCLHNAIYKSGKIQEQKNSEINFPITIKVYPKEVKKLMLTMSNRIYGQENVVSTNGKDFEYLSVVDEFGRSEVMLFAETDELLVPTAEQIFCFETKIRDHIKHQTEGYPEQMLKNEMTAIQKKDFEQNGNSLFDMTYGMRVVVTAIKSLQENKILLINDAIPIHSITNVVKKHPILTEMANNEEFLYQNIDKLLVIAKIIQNEYDTINYMKIGRKRDNALGAVSNYFGIHFCMKLSEEENNLYNEIIEQSRTNKGEIPKKEDAISESINDLRSDWIEIFLKLNIETLKKESTEENDLSKIISNMNNFELLKKTLAGKLKTYNLDFSKINQELYGSEAKFLKYLLEIDINDIDPTMMFNVMLDDVEISEYNSNSLKYIKALVFSEISKYQKNTKNMTDIGDIMYEYNLLVKNLFIAKLCINNKGVMVKNCKIDLSNFDIPLEYFDFSKLYKKIEEADIEGKDIHEEVFLSYKQDPNSLIEFTLKKPQIPQLCEILKKLNNKSIAEKDIKKIKEMILDLCGDDKNIQYLINTYIYGTEKNEKEMALIELIIEEYINQKKYTETKKQGQHR